MTDIIKTPKEKAEEAMTLIKELELMQEWKSTWHFSLMSRFIEDMTNKYSDFVEDVIFESDDYVKMKFSLTVLNMTYGFSAYGLIKRLFNKPCNFYAQCLKRLTKYFEEKQ